MEKSTEIYIDLNGRDENLVVVNAKREDTARSLIVDVLDEGEISNLTDVTGIQFGCKKSNGAKIVRDIELSCLDKTNSVISFGILGTDINVSGKTECEIILTDKNGHVTSGTFYIQVYALSIDGSNLESSPEFRTFEEELAKLLGYNADDIQFNNAQTDLTATTVQQAYDELFNRYETLLNSYEKVFREVDNHRKQLIEILKMKNVAGLSTETKLATLPKYIDEINGVNPNIYIQNEEPTEKKGIWLQRANGFFYYQIVTYESNRPNCDTDCVFIKRNANGENLYFTELFNSSIFNFPSFLVGFNDVHYQINGKLYSTTTYYGDGEKWVKIK